MEPAALAASPGCLSRRQLIHLVMEYGDFNDLHDLLSLVAPLCRPEPGQESTWDADSLGAALRPYCGGVAIWDEVLSAYLSRYAAWQVTTTGAYIIMLKNGIRKCPGIFSLTEFVTSLLFQIESTATWKAILIFDIRKIKLS